MPNKEEAVKALPNSTEHTTDVIPTAMRKDIIPKRKNKTAKVANIQNSPAVISEIDNVVANDPDIGSMDDEEIRTVSDKLLRRLHLNGTSVSVSKPNVETQREGTSNQYQLNEAKPYNKGVNAVQVDQPKGKLKQINNNSDKLHSKNDHNQCQSTQKANISSDDKNLSENSNVQCNGLCTKSESTKNSVVISNMDRDIPVGISIQPSTSNLNCVINTLFSQSALSIKSIKTDKVEIAFKEYENELQMPDIMRVIQRELSEPYSIYTYRYFIHNWPKLCFLAMDGQNCMGAIVCKLDIHRQMTKRGYIAMLAVDAAYRKLKVGTTLVQKAIEAMLQHQADEVVLETEITNIPALKLYENLGFVRDKRLFDYYLNGVDALRLKLWFK